MDAEQRGVVRPWRNDWARSWCPTGCGRSSSHCFRRSGSVRRAVAPGRWMTGRCSTGSGSRRRSTGRPRWSTPPASGRKKGSLTGPNPEDRGKPGSKLHVLTDAAGLPLAVATSAANTHDRLALIPLLQAIPAIRSRRGPRRRRPAKLHADKSYDYPHLRAWLRARGITPRIARRGIETSDRLGRHRWVIERSFAHRPVLPWPPFGLCADETASGVAVSSGSKMNRG